MRKKVLIALNIVLLGSLIGVLYYKNQLPKFIYSKNQDQNDAIIPSEVVYVKDAVLCSDPSECKEDQYCSPFENPSFNFNGNNNQQKTLNYLKTKYNLDLNKKFKFKVAIRNRFGLYDGKLTYGYCKKLSKPHLPKMCEGNAIEAGKLKNSYLTCL